ncbi:MAG: NAD(P)/FAD-dependent oxidoreductase [Vicingaceae bacterium]
MKSYDVVVIGAGPAGSVASAYLNNNGLNVLVLEKEIFPRFVIGESLLPHCMDHLEETGLLDAIKKLNFQKKTGASFYRGDKKCDFLFSEQYTKGWRWTWQVKRAEFDKALIDEVISRGVDVRFNAEVKKVTCSSKIQEVEYENKAKETIKVNAKFIIDASGYGRVLPKMFKLNAPSKLLPRGTIFTHLIDENRTVKEGENIFVHSFNNNQAWLWAIPFSDGHTSVGIVGNEKLIEEYSLNEAKKFKDFIQNFEDLKGRFKDVPLLFEPKSIMGYSIGVKQMYGNGHVLCGNSTEFLDPIFSSGVTFATFSGLKAAKLTHQQLSGNQIDWKENYENVIKHGVDVFRAYVEAWYNGDFQDIIFSKNIDPQIKNQICSVLAGYVWDETNPFIKKHKTVVSTLAKVVRLNSK